MAEQVSLKLNSALRIGFIGGAVALYLSLVGIVGTFGGRSVIDKVVSLGHTMLILTGLGTGVLAAWEIYKQPSGQLRGLPLLAGALAGLVAGSILAALIVTGSLINLRAVFLNASPALYAMLTIGRGLDGLWIPLVGGVVLGTVGALIYLLPSQVRQPLVGGSSGVLVLGLFAELLRVILAAWPGGLADASRFFFGSEGLTAKGAILTFVMISGIILVWSLRGDVVRERIHRLPTTGQTALRLTALGFACIVMLLLPVISGPFVSQVIVLVGLYALMGLGLNVTLGFAGLFDMGFVAFFAIGAYTIG
ncbi:MAG: hypothetical protein HY731_01865, partial [Candidatus Tectomicrobia bacterium]|nr:hypothetical protein [Candidatus Tectomicrobia bacterium]